MPRKYVVAAVIGVMACLVVQSQLPPIGNWRDHFSYHQTLSVGISRGLLWASTPYSLFSLDIPANEIVRFSKASGLSEAGVTAMASDSNVIVVAYRNGLIDVLGDQLRSINDIRESPLSADKRINHILIDGKIAYLATAFGIVVIDLTKNEVRDTYIVGATGEKIAVYQVAIVGNHIYAATTEGLKKAILSSALVDYRSWKTVPNLTTRAVQNIAGGSHLVALSADTVWLLDDTLKMIYAGSAISNIKVDRDQILVFEANRIFVLNLRGEVQQVISHVSLQQPVDAIRYQGSWWIASSSGLIEFDGQTFQSIIPNSPYQISSGEMFWREGNLWVTAGGISSSWQPANKPGGIFRFAEGGWTNYSTTLNTLPDSIQDIATITGDAKGGVWAGSFGGGLVHLNNQQITVYKENTGLQPVPNTKSYRVSGLALDEKKNLWISNFGSSKPIVVRRDDGAWLSFSPPFSITSQAVAQIVIDDLSQKWIILPGNGLMVLNSGDLNNPADDQWKRYMAGVGQGNLPSNNVLSIAKDRNGFLWIGTDAGIGIIPCPEIAFSPGCEAVRPVVQNDNFAGFLFSNQQVLSIAVDGANRKWIGTANGAWLISSDGEQVIYRFTKDNSPLAVDTVLQITIDHTSGEVFFLTNQGLSSFRSTATIGRNDIPLLVFPNPVPPGYRGTIAIRGIPDNSIVKVTELNGRLVNQTRALGGQAVWDVKDLRGRTISTGVYLVMISDQAGKDQLMGKIVFINR